MEDLIGYKVDAEKKNINESLKCDEDDAIVKEEEVNGMREENLRLKTLLQKIEKDYKNLQMKCIDVFQQGSNKNGAEIMTSSDDRDQELVSLRLGTSSIDSKEHLRVRTTKSTSDHSGDQNGVVKIGSEGDPAMSRNEEVRGGGERWDVPSKLLKSQRNGDDEFSQTNVKKARVCVRARCDTPTMNDGCQWRKYGQKIAKGNPCPRAYYRCTVSPTCPVRKQVQRFVEDMSILITTYEGSHNHPLPLSATAMASTTSAAASMLLSSSSTSPAATAALPLNLYGQPPPPPYFISNSSSSYSSPTITLDLITNPSSPTSNNIAFNPRFPTANLSFSSMASNMLPTLRGGGANHSFLPVKTEQQQILELSYVGNFNRAPSQQAALTETLTKVISSDPSFRSAIAAVISTMAASGGVRKMDGEMKGEITPASDSNSLS